MEEFQLVILIPILICILAVIQGKRGAVFCIIIISLLSPELSGIDNALRCSVVLYFLIPEFLSSHSAPSVPVEWNDIYYIICVSIISSRTTSVNTCKSIFECLHRKPFAPLILPRSLNLFSQQPDFAGSRTSHSQKVKILALDSVVSICYYVYVYIVYRRC